MYNDILENKTVIMDNIDNKEIFLHSIEKQWIEIQNGIECGYLKVNKSFLVNESVIEVLTRYYRNSQYTWKINYLIIHNDEENIEIYSFLEHNPNYSIKLKQSLEFDLKEVAENSYVKMTLVSELKSLSEKKFNAPAFINISNQVIHSHLKIQNDFNLFESKIDVNSYSFFEAVHPAYALQLVEIHKFILAKNISADYFVDIGSGPGTALQILIELLDSYTKIDALEPSPTAFGYLKERFKNNHFICPIQKGFFEYYPSNKLKLAISVGSSHHFNTGFLFQHANKVLENGGYLIISDEFISPFRNRKERNTNIINHHLGYIIDVLKLSHLEKDLPITCSDDEVELVRLSQKVFPKIKFEILSGNLSLAEQLCKDLLIGMSGLIKDRFDITNSFLAYYRLIYLELQALVAGLDYEVECKTYIENLICLALDNGFELTYHQKIYATSKGDQFQSGTHLVCFRKIN